MENAILTSLITGMFALATALGSIWLKHYLEQPRRHSTSGRSKARKAKEKERVSASPVARPHENYVAASSSPGTAFKPALTISVLIISFVVGATFRHFKTQYLAEATAAYSLYAFIAIAFVGLVLVHRRSPSGIWTYQLDCLTLWAAFASGYTVIQGKVWADLIITAIVYWVGYAIFGGLIVWFTRPRASIDSLDGGKLH